jgi:hypothetical protein
MGTIPIVGYAQIHFVAKVFLHFQKAIGQASLDFGHDADTSAPAIFVKALQGVFKRLFGQRVNGHDLRLQARIQHLLNLGNGGCWPR